MPCPSYFFLTTFNTSVMVRAAAGTALTLAAPIPSFRPRSQPALVAVRWIGLFTRHVRQAKIAAQHSNMSSGDYSPGPDS